jgi:hypothetical protein
VTDSIQVASAGTRARVTAAQAPARVELWFRRALLAASGLAALAMGISAGLALWSQNELAPPESVVAAHSLMLAEHGTLYYDLSRYPYTVSAYMPIFYGLEAGLIRLGLPAFAAGRLLSMAAFLGLIVVARRTVGVYTGDRTMMWIAGIAVGICPLLLIWGVVGQVDVLAVFFAAASFYQFARHDALGEPTLWRAGVLVALALFTKQTMIAAPVAMVLVLAARDWKQGLQFALALGIPLAVAVAGLNAAMDGRFAQNAIFANMNPFSGEKLVAQLQFFGGVCGGLLVICLAALPKLRAPGVYLACAAGVFLATAPKVGSDTNYQLELAVALAMCAAIGLHRLDFLRLHFAGSKSWVTLLILPLGVHAAVGVRMASNIFPARYGNEQVFRGEVNALRPLVPAQGGLVVSTDFNAMVRLRQRMDVEPLIYGLLVDAGQIDPEPVRRDLERRAISTVILHDDVFQPAVHGNAEIAALPSVQLAELRKHYRLAAHIPGPFLDGVYVYKPLEQR